jgi:agmatinase
VKNEDLTPSRNSVVVIGVPYDDNSTFMLGSAKAPPEIRKALNAGSTNMCTENGVDLAVQENFFDLGDLELDTESDVLTNIEQVIKARLEKGDKIISLGGDHAMTLPIIRAYAAFYPNLRIIQFDAHPDLYDEFEGNRYSHACPFARIMEEKLAGKLVQIGIRTMTPHQQNQAQRFKVDVIDMKTWATQPKIDFSGPVYISLDLDVLDPGFAPGVSHHEPGGLSTREVVSIIQDMNAPIVGADIVEYNPLRDVNGMTALVAAKLLKELAAKMLG